MATRIALKAKLIKFTIYIETSPHLLQFTFVYLLKIVWTSINPNTIIVTLTCTGNPFYFFLHQHVKIHAH